jgi:hypothetical protein
MIWKARRLLAVLAAAALIAVTGCATDDAAKKDAKDAQPTVEKAAKDAKKAGADAADAIDDNDSK